MSIAQMIKGFGGTSAFALALGIPISTVHAWKVKGYIPAWRQPKILELALDRKLDISAADFPDKPERAAA